ncbi:MAG TPA: pyruvate kinase [Anaerolineales bacterium]|nr:pyruvate kinase [Anaerolineales bacterium]
MERRVKIVATIGPSSNDKDTLSKLISGGVNVARFNFSHGTHQEHAETIKLLREISTQLNKPVGILQDIQGPKIRLGEISVPLQVQIGQMICLVNENVPSTCDEGTIQLPVAFEELFFSAKKDDLILIDDGHIKLRVAKIGDNFLNAVVEHGGLISSHKGINLPGVHINIPGYTEKDQIDIKFGLQQNVDFVAISFVRNVDDVLAVKQIINDNDDLGLAPLLIAKLEKPEALDNLDAILNEVDGVMVARGDLGVEMSPETVPNAQKTIIEAANRKGKIVITATQMLDSMIVNPLPTRAEASDVANAIFDGTDAVMLSGETASGNYPVEAVEMMDRIIRSAESDFERWGHFSPPMYATGKDAESITRAARELAHDLNVAAIVIFTNTGNTSMLMSKSRARVPIIGFTPNPDAVNRMCLLWGIEPRQISMSASIKEMVNKADEILLESENLQVGNQVVVLCGFPANKMRSTNMAFLHNVGEKL